MSKVLYSKIIKRIFFLRRFQFMAAALDSSSFIIKPRHQSVFWCRQGLILPNYEMLYLLHKMLSSQQKHLKKINHGIFILTS